jgi:hypothetical protein
MVGFSTLFNLENQINLVCVTQVLELVKAALELVKVAFELVKAVPLKLAAFLGKGAWWPVLQIAYQVGFGLETPLGFYNQAWLKTLSSAGNLLVVSNCNKNCCCGFVIGSTTVHALCKRINCSRVFLNTKGLRITVKRVRLLV